MRACACVCVLSLKLLNWKGNSPESHKYLVDKRRVAFFALWPCVFCSPHSLSFPPAPYRYYFVGGNSIQGDDNNDINDDFFMLTRKMRTDFNMNEGYYPFSVIKQERVPALSHQNRCWRIQNRIYRHSVNYWVEKCNWSIKENVNGNRKEAFL